MPDDRTIDFVVMFIVIGVLSLGLLSMFVGWVTRLWDRSVKRYQVVMSHTEDETDRTERTNGRTNERSQHDQLWQEFLLDRTRARIIAVMVDSDMAVSDIRGLLKGTAADIGEEIEAERQRQGKPPSQPYRTPIAGRPTSAEFRDSELTYQPPPG